MTEAFKIGVWFKCFDLSLNESHSIKVNVEITVSKLKFNFLFIELFIERTLKLEAKA